MNFATPILISDKSEDFRSLVREMLTKHGFFHLLEAGTSEETLSILAREKNNIFSIIHSEVLTETILQMLQKNGKFLIISQPQETETVSLAAKIGVKHIISFPFSSNGLFERLKQQDY